MVGRSSIDNPFLHRSVLHCCPQILNVNSESRAMVSREVTFRENTLPEEWYRCKDETISMPTRWQWSANCNAFYQFYFVGYIGLTFKKGVNIFFISIIIDLGTDDIGNFADDDKKQRRSKKERRSNW